MKVVTKGTKPGFIRLSVKAADADGSALKNGSRAVTVTSGAAVEPPADCRSPPEPKDFDAFWERQKERVRAVPMKELERVPVDCRAKGVVCYDVKVSAPGGKPMSGYLCMPENAKPKSRRSPWSISVTASIRSGRTTAWRRTASCFRSTRTVS